MSRSPEIDCNCVMGSKIYEDKQGRSYRLCENCSRKFVLVANGPDDCEWEEVE